MSRWFVPRLKHSALLVASLALVTVGLLPRRLAAQDTLIAPRAKGSASAPVTVYEMGDFQCPYCRTFDMTTFPILEKEYIATGKVRWVFIHFPLQSIHANAEPAAEFAACATKQGKFWPTHDHLYATQDQWSKIKDPVPFFMAQVKTLGLRKDEMTACLKNGVGRAMVESDATGAAKSGATSTPTFYIEGGMMSGNQPADLFRRILDSIYTAKTKKR